MDSSISSDDDDFILQSLCPSPIISSVGVGSRSGLSSPALAARDSTSTIGEQFRGVEIGCSRSSTQQEPSSASPPSPTPSPSHTTPQPIRHPTIWYHDGSIILHVQSHLFKIHQTVLSAHSEVFSGLFTLPTTKGKDKAYSVDGCPVVELQGDNWEDMEVLLKAIYEPAFWDALQPTTPLSTLLKPLSSLLTLSSKYILPTIRARSVTLIKAKLPTTYEDYLTRAQRDEKYTSESIMLSIHLGRKYDVPEILPYLFYCLARLSHRRIVDSRDGDVSWFFKTIALIGREKLRLAEIALSHSFLYAFRPSSQCLSSPLCSLSRGPQMEWRTIEAQKKPSPLRVWGKWERLGVCERCVAFCRDEHERGRREVWERLPGLVGVAGGWAELREGGYELVDRGIACGRM